MGRLAHEHMALMAIWSISSRDCLIFSLLYVWALGNAKHMECVKIICKMNKGTGSHWKKKRVN